MLVAPGVVNEVDTCGIVKEVIAKFKATDEEEKNANKNIFR